jgi:hypothetical protein
MLRLAGYEVGPVPARLDGRPGSAFRLHAAPPRTPVAPRVDPTSVERTVIALLLVLTAVFLLGVVLS